MRKVVGLAATAAALAVTGVAPADATVVGTLSATRTAGSLPTLVITNTSGTAFTGLKLEAKLKSWTNGTSVSMPLLNGTKATLAVGAKKAYTITNANHFFGFAGTTSQGSHGSATKATKSMTFKVVANNAVSTSPFGTANFNWFGFGKDAAATSAFAGSLTTVSATDPVGVPEPASVLLLAAGLMGLGLAQRRVRA